MQIFVPQCFHKFSVNYISAFGVLVFNLIIISGCSTPPQNTTQYIWQKNGGTQEEFAAVKYACLKEALERSENHSYLLSALFPACMNSHGYYERKIEPTDKISQSRGQ